MAQNGDPGMSGILSQGNEIHSSQQQQAPPLSLSSSSSVIPPTSTYPNPAAISSLFNLTHARLPGFPVTSATPLSSQGYAPPTRLPAMQTLQSVLEAGAGESVDARHASSVERMRMGPAERSANLALRQGFTAAVKFKVIILPFTLEGFRKSVQPNGGSLRLAQAELHHLLDCLQAAGLSFDAEVPTDRTAIYPVITEGLLQHAQRAGLRFLARSSLLEHSSTSTARPLPSLTAADLQKLFRVLQIRDAPAPARSTAPHKIGFVSWSTHEPVRQTYCMHQYMEGGPGSKLFDYRPVPPNPDVRAVVIGLASETHNGVRDNGTLCAPLELLDGQFNSSLPVHRCYPFSVMHKVWPTVPVPNCSTFNCLNYVYSSPPTVTPSIPNPSHSHIFPTTSSFSVPSSLSSASSSSSEPSQTALRTTTTTSTLGTNVTPTAVFAASPALPGTFHGPTSVMGLNSQSGAGANANAPPPALALNASSTRGTTEAIIQPVVEAPSPVVAAPAAASVPAPFPQPSPLMASAALVATQAQVQDVGVRRLRSQSMEEEALSVAPPLTRARARSPSIEEIDLTSVLSSPPLSPLLAVSSPAISVVLVHFLPAADPDSEGLRLWRVRVHDARRLHAPRTDGTMRLSAPTTQKGAIFLLRIIPYLRAASRGRRIERPSEPDCSFSIQDLAQFVHPTYRGYSIGAGTGQGPERETIELALETLLQQQDIRLFRQLGDTFTLDISPYASATDWNRRDRAFTFGFLLFILFFVCGSFPTNIHFSLIYAALSRSDGLNLALSPELIARFDSGAAGTLGIWVRLLRSSSSVDQVVAAIHAVNSDDAPVLQLLLDTYGCQQREPVHHLTDRLLTGNLSLSELTGNLFSTYFFGIGQADLLRAQDMMDFCAGFDWALGGGKSPTKLLSQGASTSLSPSTATVSLLDHRIESPADVLKHVKFYTDSEVGSHALYSTELQHRFIRFFLGSGRPDREEFSTLGGLHVEQEYGGGDCARVRRFFHLATGMRQLPPVTTDLRIEVSFHYGQIPPSASGMSAVEASSLQRVYPDFVYKSCSTGVQIWMNDYLRNILKEPVNVADSTQDTLFDCWMYMQVFGGGSSYTIL